jgi:hypothetical protein
VRGLGETAFRESERSAPQPGQSVEIAPALVVVDVDAFARA